MTSLDSFDCIQGFWKKHVAFNWIFSKIPTNNSIKETLYVFAFRFKLKTMEQHLEYLRRDEETSNFEDPNWHRKGNGGFWLVALLLWLLHFAAKMFKN